MLWYSHVEKVQQIEKEVVYSLALALTLTLNHLANEPLQTTTMLYGLNLRQRDGLQIFNKVRDGL